MPGVLPLVRISGTCKNGIAPGYDVDGLMYKHIKKTFNDSNRKYSFLTIDSPLFKKLVRGYKMII